MTQPGSRHLFSHFTTLAYWRWHCAHGLRTQNNQHTSTRMVGTFCSTGLLCRKVLEGNISQLVLVNLYSICSPLALLQQTPPHLILYWNGSNFLRCFASPTVARVTASEMRRTRQGSVMEWPEMKLMKLALASVEAGRDVLLNDFHFTM